jgi:hypothetical protein
MRKLYIFILLLTALSTHADLSAQNILQRIDGFLSKRYYKGGIDTAYIVRPQTEWTVTARLNVSGTYIESEGMEDDLNNWGNKIHFKAEMEANSKATLSVGVSYLGMSISAAVNPAKLLGRYHDYELNFKSYGRRFGFDIVYQDAKNFTGWYDSDGIDRIDLPDGMLKVKTLNANAFFVFNSRRFSFPAAFSQSYIQRRSAGSFLLAASFQGQQATLDWEQPMDLKMTNIGLGAGYGYNFVPGKGWLFHISALPTFIVYSNTSMTFDNENVPLEYHFPEAIITGRGAIVRQWGNKFLGLSMVYNFTNIGDVDNLALHDVKWYIRTFFGLRFGKAKTASR